MGTAKRTGYQRLAKNKRSEEQDDRFLAMVCFQMALCILAAAVFFAACRAASLGHYWNEIRVQGGAYGTGLLIRETGLVSAYTYRDPDCRRSRGAIGRTAAYLEAAAASGEAQDVNIIGAISDAEPLLSPRLQGAVADAWLLKGMTMDDRRRMRRELLDAGPASLAACAGQIGSALDSGVVCALGPRPQLEACGDLELQEL